MFAQQARLDPEVALSDERGRGGLTSSPTQKDNPMLDNDAQAKALVAALAPMIAAAIIPQLTEQVEKQIKGVVAKNDELLDKLANLKKDDEIAANGKAADDLMAKTKALIDGASPKKENALTDFRKGGDPIRISRADARDTAIYRKAKALAAEQGVALEIASEA